MHIAATFIAAPSSDTHAERRTCNGTAPAGGIPTRQSESGLGASCRALHSPDVMILSDDPLYRIAVSHKPRLARKVSA